MTQEPRVSPVLPEVWSHCRDCQTMGFMEGCSIDAFCLWGCNMEFGMCGSMCLMPCIGIKTPLKIRAIILTAVIIILLHLAY